MSSKIFQAIVGLILFFILNYIAIAIMKREDLIEDPTKSVKQPIFSGWIDTKSFSDKSYTTYNMFAKNYRKLPRSVNKTGGAQFSYSVWVKFKDFSDKNLANKVLFVHGDKSKYPYSVTASYNGKKGETRNLTDYLIKCPLVRFGNNAGELIIEYNTTKNVSESVRVIHKDNDKNETIRRNLFSIIPGKWTLFTFVFRDDKRYDSPEDGVELQFYLNDVMYTRHTSIGGLRLNKGDIHILPNTTNDPISEGYMCDLTYYNYALNMNDVKDILKRGVNTKRYSELEDDADFNEPLHLSQYNKLEIYNM
jgi:hypothetical protein